MSLLNLINYKNINYFNVNDLSVPSLNKIYFKATAIGEKVF